jgi:hypothetical protein
LATFRELTPEVLNKVMARASTPIKEADLVASAARAGAPVALPQADRAARRLVKELATGDRPSPALRMFLRAALAEKRRIPDSARWIGATMTERAQALVDLLGLVDALPVTRRDRRGELRYPRLDSSRHVSA